MAAHQHRDDQDGDKLAAEIVDKGGRAQHGAQLVSHQDAGERIPAEAGADRQGVGKGHLQQLGGQQAAEPAAENDGGGYLHAPGVEQDLAQPHTGVAHLHPDEKQQQHQGPFAPFVDGQGAQVHQQPQQHAAEHHEAELEWLPQQVQFARHLAVAGFVGRRRSPVQPPERQQVAQGNGGEHDAGHLEDHCQVAAEVLHIGKPQPHQEQDKVDHLAERLVDQLDQPGRGEGNQIADHQR